MLDKQTLVDLGIKHGFCDWLDHESPRNYFIRHHKYFTDVDNRIELCDSVMQLYTLLCEIYTEVGVE
jgi:hypothetical protein